jgi:hypothetical protein
MHDWHRAKGTHSSDNRLTATRQKQRHAKLWQTIFWENTKCAHAKLWQTIFWEKQNAHARTMHNKNTHALHAV